MRALVRGLVIVYRRRYVESCTALGNDRIELVSGKLGRDRGIAAVRDRSGLGSGRGKRKRGWLGPRDRIGWMKLSWWIKVVLDDRLRCRKRLGDLDL